jgi:ABC-type sugar transport system permease subunit
MAALATSAQRTGASPGRKRRRRIASWTPYLMVLPAVAVYFVFKLAPMIGGVFLSLIRWDGIEPARFVGLANFERMFEDELIVMALANNVKYAIGTVVGKIVLALLVALLLNQSLRGRGFYRTALFTPVVMSFVVVGILWAWLYNSQFGLVNSLLRGLGLDFMITEWLGDTRAALNSLMIVDIWKWYGFHMVIFLAGLQTIPNELYEAARIDGASRWQQFVRITLPMLSPVMLVNVTISLMGAFNVFDIPYVMTEGGPANSTLVMSLHIYLQSFKFYKFGYGAAMSYAMLILISVMAAVQIKLMSRNTDH